MRPSCVFALIVAGCAAKPPARPTSTSPIAPAPTASTTSAAKATKPPPFERYATRANSGANACKLKAEDLGPAEFRAGSPATMTAGFGPWGGLVAWTGPTSEQVSFREVNSAGAPRGKLEQMSAPKNLRPRHLVAIEGGFVLVAELYEFSHERWAAIVTDLHGKPLGKPIDLELEHRYVQDISTPSARSFVVLATRALMVPDDKQDLPGIWLDVSVDETGKLTQKAHELAFQFPLVRVVDQALPFELAAKPGWYVQRGGEPEGELLLDGKLERLARASLASKGVTDAMLSPKDRVEFMLSMDENGSTFGRLVDGKLIGEQLTLPPGSTGIVDPVLWSGTHWIIPHARQAATASTAALVAIDCK